MSSDQTVKVTLIAVAQPYVKGVTEAGTATAKLGKGIDDVSAKSKGMGGSLDSAGAALKGVAVAGGALVGTALVDFLRDSVRAAGDLQQSVGGVDAVFKGTAAKVHAFGQTSAEAVGLSRNEFNQLITVTGALLKNKGLDDFTGKSLDLVKVGADLAATFGGSTAKAVEALNAAMRGESDPIEKYGISLNETAVNAELAAKGLGGLKGAALEQAKAQARLDLITRQSADALGKFASEANTLQGQQQRLNAEWEDAKAELGTALLPALTQVVQLMRDGVGVVLAAKAAWESLPGPVQAAVVALIAFRVAQSQLATVGTGAVSVVKSLGEAIGYARMSAADAGGGFAGLGAGLRTFSGSASLAGSATAGLKSAGSALMGLAGGPWGLAIMGLTAAIGGWSQKQAEARARVDELSGSLDKQTGRVTENTRAIVAKRLQDEGVFELARKVGVSLADVTDAAVGNAEALGRVNAALAAYREESTFEGATSNAEDLRTALGALNADTSEAVSKHRELAEAVSETGTKAQNATTPTATLAGTLKDQQQAAEGASSKHRSLADTVEAYLRTASSATDATKAYADALRGFASPVLDAREASRQWEQSIADAEKAITANIKAQKNHKLSTAEQAQAQRDAEDALDGVARSALNQIGFLQANGASQQQLQQTVDASRVRLEQMAVKFGMSSAEAKAYADRLLGIPAVRATQVTADVSQANAALTSIFNYWSSKTITLRAQVFDERVPVAQRAGGGYITGPGTSTSDSIPALLSNGEYVMRAAAVKHYGLDKMHAINAMRFAAGGLASGGPATVNSTVSLPADGWSLTGKVDIGGMVVDLVDARLSRVGARAGVREF